MADKTPEQQISALTKERDELARERDYLLAEREAGRGERKLKLPQLTEFSEDRTFGDNVTPNCWAHVEILNFRHDSRYDDNWLSRARSALETALKQDFGALDKAGFRAFPQLPAFDPSNRLIVMVMVERGA